MTDNQEITIYTGSQEIAAAFEFSSARGFSIDAIIGGWLEAIKLKRSQSEKTQKAYRDTIISFRALLQEHNLDLLSARNLRERALDISDAAQVFARQRSPRANRTNPITVSTQAQRLAILSSFYSYCLKHGHTLPEFSNPIDLVERPSVEPYAASEALDREEVLSNLERIDRETDIGARDYALLAVLLVTGRRVSEIAAMKRDQLQRAGDIITITFERTKGGKVMRDKLDPDTSAALISWIYRYYHAKFWRMPGDTPVWPNLTNKIGSALGYKGIAGICQSRLGVSTVHSTRATFAIAMEDSGATLTDIQQRLGHSSPTATGIYMGKVKRDRNKYSQDVASKFGITAKKKRA